MCGMELMLDLCNVHKMYEKLTAVCLEHHSSMMNVTSRLAIKVRHLPDFEFNWSDCSPQRSREDIVIDDLLPSVKDSKILHLQALDFTVSCDPLCRIVRP